MIFYNLVKAVNEKIFHLDPAHLQLMCPGVVITVYLSVTKREQKHALTQY